MEVILLKDQPTLGRRGQVMKVKPGYARNFLLPQGLALQATPSNMKVFESRKKKIDLEHTRERDAAAEIAAQISSIHLKISKRSTDGTNLYGSVTATEIHDLLVSKGVTLDRRRIDLEGGIKTVGDHQIRLELHHEVAVELLVTVHAQE